MISYIKNTYLRRLVLILLSPVIYVTVWLAYMIDSLRVSTPFITRNIKDAWQADYMIDEEWDNFGKEDEVPKEVLTDIE